MLGGPTVPVVVEAASLAMRVSVLHPSRLAARFGSGGGTGFALSSSLPRSCPVNRLFAAALDMGTIIEVGLWYGFDRSACIAVGSSALGAHCVGRSQVR